MAENFSVQMKNVLEEYSEQISEVVSDAMVDIGKEAVTKLKSTSPKKSGEYARGWRIKKTRANRRNIDVTVYNIKKPSLTHLLENGHVIRNKYGTFGRVGGRKHIEPVAEWAETELTQTIEREL